MELLTRVWHLPFHGKQRIMAKTFSTNFRIWLTSTSIKYSTVTNVTQTCNSDTINCYHYYYEHPRWVQECVGGRGRSGRGRHTLWCQPASSRRWAVEVRVFTHAHVSMITYRADVYRSRPIGASLLSTSPQQECLALKGLHMGWLAGRGDGYLLNTNLDWGLSNVL